MLSETLTTYSRQMNELTNVTHPQLNLLCSISRWNTEGQMEEKPEWGIICSNWMRGRTAEGAHLLFGLFLIAADLQVILQHSAQRQRDVCYCSHDLLSARIRSVMASCNLQFPFKSLFGERINYTAESSKPAVHVGEWGSGHSLLKTYQMFSFWSSGRKARLFFHLETFCLTTADLQPRIPWKQKRRCSADMGPSSRLCTDF